MKLQDLAHELYSELGEPSDLSPMSILYWLASNIGQLNSLLNKSYALDSTSAELSEDLGLKEGAVLKKLYLIKSLDSKVREFLGAAGTNIVQSISSDGGILTLVNKSEQAKTYNSMKKDELLELQKLVNAYLSSDSSIYGLVGSDGSSIYPEIKDPIIYRRRYY